MKCINNDNESRKNLIDAIQSIIKDFDINKLYKSLRKGSNEFSENSGVHCSYPLIFKTEYDYFYLEGDFITDIFSNFPILEQFMKRSLSEKRSVQPKLNYYKIKPIVRYTLTDNS